MLNRLKLPGFLSFLRKRILFAVLNSLFFLLAFTPQHHSTKQQPVKQIVKTQQKAQTFLRKNLFDSALFYFRQSALLAMQKGEETTFLTLRLQMAGCYLRMGKYDSTLQINRQVLITSREKQLIEPEMIAEGALGQLAMKEEKYREALQHFTSGLSLAKKLHNRRAIAYAQLNLGNTFSKLGLYNEAHSAFSKGILNTDYNKNSHLKTLLTRGLAHVMEKTGKPDSNRILLKTLEAPVPSTLSTEQKLRHALDRARYYQKAGELQQASRYYQIAETLAGNTGRIQIQILALKHLAEIALQSNQPETAIYRAKKALILTQKQPENLLHPEIYRILYASWKERRIVDSALYYHEKLALARQKVYHQHQNENLAELRIKYQTDRTQKRLLQLENEALQKDIILKTRQIQINTLLGGSFTLAVIMMMLVGFFYYKQKKDKKIRQQEKEKLFLEKEAEATRSLMLGEEKERQRIAQELHDGIGVLLSSASIYFSDIEKNNLPENTQAMTKIKTLLVQAGTEVRRISQNMMPVVLKQFGLQAALEDLLADFSEKTGIATFGDIALPLRLNEKKEIMIYRIVQELLHNTLKHSKADKVTFLLHKNKDTLEVNYTDNGKGFLVKDILYEKGLGIPGIRNRIKILHGTFKMSTSPGNGFSFNILFPFS